MGVFRQITDDGFPGAKSLDFIGQRIVYAEPFGRYWGWSSLVDGSSWNSLDQAQAETSPDRIQGLIVSHNEVLIFGERTIEPWASAPTDTAVFQLQTGSVIECGCASGKTIQRLDNSVFFLTNNGQIARLNGYTPLVVSTAAMEASIRGLNWSRAFSFTWEDAGHVVYYITFPDGMTWGFDVRQNKWHRRESYGLDRWRINALAKSNGKWIAGDYSSGRVYEVEWGNVYEACEIMPRKFRSGVLHNASNRVRVDGFRIVAATGQPPIMPVQVDVQWPVNYLLITGSPTESGGPVFAAAEATPTPSFVGLSLGSGADLAAATPALYDDTWVAATNTSVRYSTNNRETWQTGTAGVSEPIDRVVGASAGWLTASRIDLDEPPAVGATPAAFVDTNITATGTDASDQSADARAANIVFRANEQYFLCRAKVRRAIYRADVPGGPYTALWDVSAEQAVGRNPNGAHIFGWFDLAFHDGEWYAVIGWHFDLASRRYQVIKSSSLTDWTNFTVVVDVPRAGEGHRPAYLYSGGGHLVCHATAGAIWTSANGWSEPILTGIGGPGFESTYDGFYMHQAPRIAYVNGLFYIIGNTDELVTFDADTLTMSAPFTLPISSTVGIVATSVLPEEEDIPDTCTPMESGVFQLRYSNDGAENWLNWRDFEAPATGRFLQPLVARRLGMARHRVWEVMDTSNRPQDVLAAEIIAQ